MKATSKYFVAALAMGCGLTSIDGQAQQITGTPYLSNLTTPTALYGSWASGIVSATPTGIRVQASGYGSGYWVVPSPLVQSLNASATQIQFTMTVNDLVSDYNWVYFGGIVHDDLPAPTAFTYGAYSGFGNGGNPLSASWSGNTATLTFALNPSQLLKVQTGNDHIYALNLEFNPAYLLDNGGPATRSSYDVTFNSVQFTPVPEPGAPVLLGLGAVCLLQRWRARN